MKDAGIKPDLATYNYLLDACGRAGLTTEAWASFEDMQSTGIAPDIQTMNHLLNVSCPLCGLILPSNLTIFVFVRPTVFRTIEPCGKSLPR